MSIYPYHSVAAAPSLGLVVLQVDETIEADMRQLLGDAQVYVSRVPSGAQVTRETLAEMAAHLGRSAAVTEPVTALVAACAHLGLRRLALLSPYVAAVSDHLRTVLGAQGIDTPVFGTFAEAEEAKVARIAPDAIIDAAKDLCADADVDGVFLSCTNLRTLPVIDRLEAAVGLPVLSSNLVLAWHMAQLAAVPLTGPGRLLKP